MVAEPRLKARNTTEPRAPVLIHRLSKESLAIAFADRPTPVARALWRPSDHAGVALVATVVSADGRTGPTVGWYHTALLLAVLCGLGAAITAACRRWRFEEVRPVRLRSAQLSSEGIGIDEGSTQLRHRAGAYGRPDSIERTCAAATGRRVRRAIGSKVRPHPAASLPLSRGALHQTRAGPRSVSAIGERVRLWDDGAVFPNRNGRLRGAAVSCLPGGSPGESHRPGVA